MSLEWRPGTTPVLYARRNDPIHLGSRQGTIMRLLPAGAGLRSLVLVLGAGVAMYAVHAGAAQQPREGKKDDPAKTQPKSSDSPTQKAEVPKTYAFEMRNKPWDQVIEWLTDTTGLAFVGVNKPTGSFNFVDPKKKQYTIPEIIDFINEGLTTANEKQKYTLLRRERTFTFVPVDEQIDPLLVPRVTMDQMDKYGNSEVVSLEYPAKGIVAEDVASEIQKHMMSPFGRVAHIPGANYLILQDSVGNLRRLLKTFQDIEKGGGGDSTTFSHKCVYVKARDAEKLLLALLGDPTKLLNTIQQQQNQQQGGRGRFGGGGGFGGGGFGGGGFGGGGFAGAGFGGDMGAGGAAVGAQQPVQPAQKIRMHYVRSDEASNTVFVAGPANVIAQAKDIVERFDKQLPGRDKVLVGPPQVKTYSVPAGMADTLSKTLQERYKEVESVKINAAGTSKIVVAAPADDQVDIQALLVGATEDGDKAEIVPLNTRDSGETATTLQSMFGKAEDAKGVGPYISADSSRNGILIKGTKEQIAEVKAVIRVLDGGEAGGIIGNTSFITLDRSVAPAMANEIMRILQGMGKYDVKVITPGAAPEKKEEKKEPVPPPQPAKEKPPGTSDQRKSEAPWRKHGVLVAARGYVAELGDPQEQKGQEKKDEKKDGKDQPKKGEITITAAGDRLIIHSDDPDAMRMVNELIRLIKSGKEGDFQVIKLKKANAVDVAKVLDEMYNGPRQQGNPQQFQFGRGGFGGGPGGGFGGFGGFAGGFGGGGRGFQGGAPQAAATDSGVRVVADPGTNSLLVRAKPLDMLQIKYLVEKFLDVGDEGSDAVIRTHFLRLQHANAQQVASILRDVYRESINNNPAPGQRGGGGFAAVVNRNLDATGNPRGVTLSISVDDATNSLILGCPNSMFKDIETLVKQLELAAKESTRTVRFIPITGVDPTVIQQALMAIQGISSTQQRPGFGGFGGGFGGPGFGGGGFGGGGRPGGFGGGGFGGGGFGGAGLRGGGGFSAGAFRGAGPAGGAMTRGMVGVGRPGIGRPGFAPGSRFAAGTAGTRFAQAGRGHWVFDRHHHRHFVRGAFFGFAAAFPIGMTITTAVAGFGSSVLTAGSGSTPAILIRITEDAGAESLGLWFTDRIGAAGFTLGGSFLLPFP